MIGALKGIISEILVDTVIIDVSGVGYEVYLPLRVTNKLQIGGECKLVIYTNVKEDQLSLFGFDNQLDKKIFLDLIKVSGIGAKTALSILGSFDAGQIQHAVAAQDAKLFQTISGIGKKASERIIMDLKDKYKNMDVITSSGGFNQNLANDNNVKDAISALGNLGYSTNAVLKVIEKTKDKAGSLEELITLSLKELA